MNKEWSELNKAMQIQIRKNDTYKVGIRTLFDLRKRLMQTLISIKEELYREDFDAIPFINACGVRLFAYSKQVEKVPKKPIKWEFLGSWLVT